MRCSKIFAGSVVPELSRIAAWIRQQQKTVALHCRTHGRFLLRSTSYGGNASLSSGTTLIFAFLIGVICIADVIAEPLNVRVKNTSGGPQIFVNGRSVPPRFFWGSERGGRISVGKEWKQYSFEFLTESPVDGNGTLHFRFADTAGEVFLKGLSIKDMVDGSDVLPSGSFATREAFEGRWCVWPPGDANTVGELSFAEEGLRVALREHKGAGKRPDFHLHCGGQRLSFAKGHRYRCEFSARASIQQELNPAVYRIDSGTYTCIGGPAGPFLNQVALARDAGVNLVSFSAPACWGKPEVAQDWMPLDALCQRIVAVNPKVLLVPRVSANAPAWWLERHPEARMVYDPATSNPMACVSDRAYRKDVCAHLEKICRHLCESFPDHFAGIHPCGQNTGEWFYYNSWMHPLSGYDPATRNAFREWMSFQGDPAADKAEPPSAAERRAHPDGFLRDPASEKRLIDFARFQQQEMSDFVKAMAAACRRGTAGEKLVIFFYGYGFEFAPLSNGAPTSGHYALGSLLQSRDVDILCSPISYTDREWLGTAPVMSAAESVMKAGILWLNEDDSRTFLDPRKQAHVQEGGLVNLEQTQQVMLRNTAQAALRGFGTWWMDLPGQGWFNDAAIWREIERLRPVDEAMLSRKTPFTPEIAAIIDENSMCHLTGGSSVTVRPLIYEGRAALGRCGAPYGQYLLPDLLDGKVNSRMQVFLSAWSLTQEQRRKLARLRTAEDNQKNTRVWCWAPGYIFPDRTDVAGINEVTGFKASPVSLPSAKVTPTDVGRKLGITGSWGPEKAIAPLFSVVADPSEVLATFSDGSAAVAMHSSKDGLDVFVGVPQLTPELVHAIAKMTGVHLYTSPGAALWAAEGYISVQAHEDRPVDFDIGCKSKAYDALDGTELGEGPHIRLDMKKGETRVLRF